MRLHVSVEDIARRPFLVLRVALCEVFRIGHEAYKMRKWTEAKGYFERVLTCWPKDGPASIFLKRCEEYIADEPSEDWEGVYVIKHK